MLGCCFLGRSTRRLALCFPRTYFVSAVRYMASSSTPKYTKSVPNTERPDVHNNACIDVSVPNEFWSEEMLAEYNKYLKLVAIGEWRKLPSYFDASQDQRLFTRNLPPNGKSFEYATFLNDKEKILHGIVQFGPWLQGPKMFVHGGAIATMFDSLAGVLVYNLGYRILTLNLNVNFRRPLPLGTVAIGEVKVEKSEGSKIYTSAVLRSLDGNVIYDEATILWYNLAFREAEKKSL